jgi:UDP-glucose 4-epimerase
MELARAWSSDNPPLIEFSGQLRAGDPYSLCANVERLGSLGISCATSVSDGVAEYVQWFCCQKGQD